MNESDIILSPAGNVEQACAAVAWIQAREKEILAEMNAIDIDGDNWNAPETKAALERFGKVVEDLRESGKKLVERVLADTEAQRVVTAIDSRLWSYSTRVDPNCAYARLSRRLKDLKDMVAECKRMATPPAPRHTYIIQVEMTDADLKTVLKAMDKCGASYRYTAPQSDAAVESIEHFFNNN